jgi:putative transposase
LPIPGAQSPNIRNIRRLTIVQPRELSRIFIWKDLQDSVLATLSDGKTFPNHQPLKKQLYRLKRRQRQLSKKEKGSKNRAKAKKHIAKLHYKIASSRSDTLHKLTTTLTTDYQNIAIEDLDVSQMVKRKGLSRSIMDSGWYEFRRQLIYKAELKGNKVFIADKWYASSKSCSSCGHSKKELSLSERIYKCTNCQLEIDRDLNASICLVKLINTVSSTEIQACGQGGSVIMLNTSLQPAWLKQELSHV